MLAELKKIYYDNIITDPKETHDPTLYKWFRTHEAVLFGIRKNAITDNEQQLLALSFIAVLNIPGRTDSDQSLWSAILFDGILPNENKSPTKPFRLILFSLKHPIIEREDLDDVMSGLFPAPSVILWETSLTGLIIDFNSSEDSVDYEDIVEMIISDFYVDPLLYIGPLIESVDDAQMIYQEQLQFFQSMCHVFPEKRVFNSPKLLPLAIIEDMPDDKRRRLFDQIFSSPSLDEELLKSIFVFLESNMNISIASKKLFIHRNSLQYRIEKFHEKTQLDPKQFQDAAVIYLAILEQKLSRHGNHPQKLD